MVVDHIDNFRLYNGLPRLARAFELLRSPQSATWPDGRMELDGDRIIAMPQGYLTKPASEGKWEAHRRYIDIQFIVAGAEKMGWAPVVSLEPIGVFDATRDVGFYTGAGDMITVRQGMFTLFYPQDAHMPCLHVGNQPEQVRKIVMKVAIEG